MDIKRVIESINMKHDGKTIKIRYNLINGSSFTFEGPLEKVIIKPKETENGETVYNIDLMEMKEGNWE